MTREKAIEIIEALYPADCGYDDTAEIGRRLLAEAKLSVQTWRSEPDAVLYEYARLCQREHDRSLSEKRI